jgi:nicotinate dehydrogenase subunit B
MTRLPVGVADDIAARDLVGARSSNLRAPGKIANCFAVESFFDEMAAAIGRDPVELRLKGLSDPRGIEVLKRTVAMMKWQPCSSPVAERSGPIMRGRGIAYIHKFQETSDDGDGSRGRACDRQD